MKGKDKIEKIFRDRLGSEEAPISDRVWENIKKSLPPEEPKSPYILYYVLGITAIVLVTGLASVYKYSQEGTSIAAENFSSSNPEIAANTNSIVKKENDGKKEASAKYIISDEEGKLEDSENARTNKNIKDNNYFKVLNNRQRDLFTPTQKEKNLIGNSLELRNKEMRNDKSSVSINKEVEFISLDSSSKEEISRDIKSSSIVANSGDLNRTGNSLIELTQKEFVGSDNSFQIPLGRGDLMIENLNLNEKDSIKDDQKEIVVLNKSELKKTIDSVINKDTIEKTYADKNKKEKKLFFSHPISLDFYVSPLISYRTISAPSDVKNDLNNNEKVRLNLGAGIKINFDLNEKWKVGIGVNYSAYGEGYKLGKNYYKEKTAYFGYYQQDSTGAFIVKTDSSKYMEKYSVKVKNNYYRYVGIPIYITRVVSEGKLGIAMTLGASMNFLTRAYTSRVRSLTDTIINVIEESSQSHDSPFRKVSASAFLTSTFSYEINSRWKVLLDPGLTYFITSTYKSDYLINRHLFAFQVMAGLRYTLKK